VVRDGETGFLIAADDAAGYARRLEQLLANPAQRERVAELAFVRTTREYNWPAYCRCVGDLYEEVLERATTRKRSQLSLAQACLLPGRSMRRSLRDGLFAVARKVLATDDGKAMVTDCLRGLLDGRPTPIIHGGSSRPPYSDLGAAQAERQTERRTDAIFVTGRFRSGSTLLWNLFRNIPTCTAYYEPLNERRWFDPAVRGDRTDATHRNVSDYWKEYDGLLELGDFYREEWVRRNLYMDEHFWDPGLKRYVEILIERARRRPVLQFNRIDFRLPWFRRNFPEAKIVHLYRHPRDQWCSALMNPKCFSRHDRVADFAAHDKFYLLTWVNDLKYHFPFLEPAAAEHPYQLFYYVWKLSYLFGQRFADYSLAFESLVGDPASRLKELFSVLDVRGGDVAALEKLLDAPPLGKWTQYADDAWFRDHEATCETVLAEFLSGNAATRPRHQVSRASGAECALPRNRRASLQTS
jgi:hypothetical protein